MIFAPTPDFSQVLADVGQSATLRKVTRTVDTNGNVTGIATTDLTITTQVQEVGEKEKLYLTLGIVDIGDVVFYVLPSVDVTIYDRIIWNAQTFNVVKILRPPMINNTLLYKKILTVRDTSDSS